MSCTTEALVVDSAGADPQLKTVSLGPLQDKEVLVEIHATGICHTDIACMEGKLPSGFPSILGHEGLLISLYAVDAISKTAQEPESSSTWDKTSVMSKSAIKSLSATVSAETVLNAHQNIPHTVKIWFK